MGSKLFLDAIIGREDFDVQDQETTSQGPNKSTLGFSDFKIPGFFFASLRKPDFQRETNEWDVEKVSGLVSSFLDGDLIPAIILWKHGDSFTFVIDGAHRISAIAAWVNDDYGDGKLSRKFFDNNIPESQLTAAREARDYINENIGAFKEYEDALFDNDGAREIIRKRLRNFGTRAIQLQWVDGDSKKAERSFFTINQKSTPISDSEISILESRRKPSGLSARIIMRGGQGFSYWSSFNPDIASAIKSIGLEIHKLIFLPILSTPLKTLDLPLGGKNHAVSTLGMIYDLVSFFKSPQEVDDIDGNATLSLLNKIRSAIRRVNSVHPSSLGLHPAVYIYSNRGNFRISCFHAAVQFADHLEKHKLLKDFTNHRESFEYVILNSDNNIQAIVRKMRQANKAIAPIVSYYAAILESLQKGTQATDVLKEISAREVFSYLKSETNSEYVYDSEKSGAFSRETKSAAFIRDALPSALRCAICGGFLNFNAIQVDHIKRKQDGGCNKIDNAQLAHPYCNSTFKEN